MSVVINTNTAASIAANNLSYANNQLTDAINQLSSGSRLADPAADPGDVGVSLRLTSQADNAGVQNTLDQSQLANDQTTSGAINVIGDIVTRISELSTMVGGTSNASDIANYNAEFTSLNGELTTLNADAGSNSAITSLAAATDLSASGTSADHRRDHGCRNDGGHERSGYGQGWPRTTPNSCPGLQLRVQGTGHR